MAQLPCVALSWPLTFRHILGVAIAIDFHHGFLKVLRIYDLSCYCSNLLEALRICAWRNADQTWKKNTNDQRENPPILALGWIYTHWMLQNISRSIVEIHTWNSKQPFFTGWKWWNNPLLIIFHVYIMIWFIIQLKLVGGFNPVEKY